MDAGRPTTIARLGGAGVLLAIAVFLAVCAVSVMHEGTTYVWPHNMISDLGDTQCRERGGRWICAPGHAWFNASLVLTGAALAVSGLTLVRAWGRSLAGGVTLMGLGLVVAGVFPAGETAGMHFVGVVLTLLPPGFALMVSGIRPEVPWLAAYRVPRGLLGGLALVLAAESRLPLPVIPAGAGQIAIVACLIVALLGEAGRLVVARPVGVPATLNR